MLNPIPADILMTLGDTPALATSVSDATLLSVLRGYAKRRWKDPQSLGVDQRTMARGSRRMRMIKKGRISLPSYFYSTDAAMPRLPPCYSDAWMPGPASTNTPSPRLPSPSPALSLSCHSPLINVLEETSRDDEPASKKNQINTATSSALRERGRLEAMAAQWARKSEGEAIAASEALGLDLEEVKRAFSNTLNWMSSIIATPAKAAVMPRDGTQRRSEVVKMIQNGLPPIDPKSTL
ncbi:hypothetical protein C8R45DRAFT_936527 [Mycena sanguinolenta]|nr:hypothetical protein C8R45DRAFT_936527 [Mycena sanguinolenta]